jgi:DNA-binding GntR family transcriptional regulator
MIDHTTPCERRDTPVAQPLAAAGPSGAGVPLDRPSTAQRVAEVLREQVLQGELPPGTQMPEQQLTAALGVSRNTLREAFQILVGECLLVREPHRGVFVRTLDAADVRDIYAFRRLVECAALADPVDEAAYADMRLAVTQGRAAARRRDWHEVGTADVRFHVAITAVAGSERLDRAMRATFAELRLAFHLVPEPRTLHRPYLELNAEILELAEQGRSAQASERLRAYLDDAEARLVAVIEGG